MTNTRKMIAVAVVLQKFLEERKHRLTSLFNSIHNLRFGPLVQKKKKEGGKKKRKKKKKKNASFLHNNQKCKQTLTVERISKEKPLRLASYFVQRRQNLVARGNKS